MSDLEAPARSIPANVEAERAVLGSLMIDPDAILKVINFLRPEDFFRERHGWLYEAMYALHERREPLDFVTLVDELDRQGRLEEIGGPAYLSDLIASTPTALYIDHYARIVERTAILRRLIGAAGKIAELAYDESQEVDEVVDRAEQIVFGVSESRVHRDLAPIRAIMNKVVDRIDFLSRNQDTLMGVPTGFTMLDRLLGGLQKSDLIILAGRPGMGKCVAAHTLLVDPMTGERHPIEQLVKERKATVLTLNTHHKLEPTAASHFIDDGVKPLYGVQTASGRMIEVTLTHPFLTVNGWLPLGELEVGDVIAVPSVLPVFGQDDAPAHEVKVLAYELAADKFIPQAVFRYTRPKLALFLNCLFACSGALDLQNPRHSTITYSTASKTLAYDIRHLLLRFGILARLCTHPVRYQGDYRPTYRLEITKAENLWRFYREISGFGQAEAIAGMQEIVDILVATGQVEPSPNELRQSHIDWEPITHIEYLGEQQVYDLTIPQTHNFVANDMLVHNTSFGLSVAQNAAKRNARVAIFSLEMSNDQLVQRLLSMETAIDSHRLRLGAIHEEEWPIVLEAANMLAQTSIFIDDTPAASVTEIRTKSRRLYAEHGLDLIVIDYMQLMTGQTGGRNENRQQEISYISRSLKSLARELNVPVIALSQLSRAVETRADKRPMLSDLRESGSIEQDADVVLFIYREDYYIEDTDRQNIADVLVAKHRHGATGTVSLYFRKELTQFRDLEIQRTELEY